MVRNPPANKVTAILGICFVACSCALNDTSTHSIFFAETSYPYLTSDPYGWRASFTFPENPTKYYEQLRTARDMRYSGDCASAAPRFQELVREYREDSEVWFDLGMCQAEIGERESAVQSLQTALALGTVPSLTNGEGDPIATMIKIAWLYAEIGEVENSLDWLRRGLEARFTRRSQIALAPEAANLLGSVEFATLAGIAPERALTRDEQWRYDIGFLRDQVALLHLDPDQHTSADELERTLQRLSDAIPVLTDEQIIARLTLFVGQLGAGHDFIFHTTSQLGLPTSFGLRAYFFSDGLYAIDAEDKTLIGAEITSFGQTKTDVAFEVVANAIARDNPMTARSRAPSTLMNPDVLEALGIVDNAQTATLSVVDSMGHARVILPQDGVRGRGASTLGPSPLTPAKTPLYLSRLQTPYWTARIDDLKALYVQLNIIYNAQGEDFTAFAERVKREAADPDVKHLILDLRHCPGGDDYLIPRISRTLIHFDDSPEKGDLYVLIGRRTYSAAQILVTDIDRLTDSIFVGEPTGSRPNFFGRLSLFTLPYSRLTGSLSSQYAQTSSSEDHRIWVAPDVPVGLSSEDFFAGRDPALEAIGELIGAAETK